MPFRIASRVFLVLPFLAALAAPVSPAAAARATSSFLQTPDTAFVSRGDFLRAAVRTLDIAVPKETAKLTRVPSALAPFVQAARDRGALRAFGAELKLAQPITRGEALQVLADLQKLSAPSPQQFTDIRSGSAVGKAVGVAIERGWMESENETLFGVAEKLKGSDGRLLLRKVQGQGGVQEDRDQGTVPTIQIKVKSAKGISRQLPKAQILEAVWELIQRDFLYEDKIDSDAAAYDAADALVQSLGDPYSTFMKPVNSRDFQTRINGELTGIGAQVEERDGILTVVTPFTGSPAEKAGIKPGDEILAVDGVSIVDVGFAEAVEHVRGPRGSTAKLRIRRGGAEFDVSVMRDLIKVPEIEISWQGEIAIVKLLQFGKLTDTELRPAMKRVQAQSPSGIILDLRNNPGGLLHAANTVLSNFLPKGSAVAVIKTRDDTRTDTTEELPTIAAAVPVVVLVNEGSASASEIVAGALQDAGRATLVGTVTFGKGTVQEILEFTDGSSLKLTIAEWLTPLGRKIDGVGVEPDVSVPYSDRDEQMLRAIEILRQRR